MTFGSSDTSKTFTFNATQDTVDDDGESVKLGFGMLPHGITAGSTSETTVSITDDDVPSVVVSFEQATYSVDEGDSVTVKVTLSADPERTVTIPLTKTNQDGATDSDYSGVPATVIFNSGDTENTFAVSATDDSANDDGQSVKLTFGTLPPGVSQGTTSETVVSINDNDGGFPDGDREIPGGEATPITVSFEQTSYTAREGSAATIKVILSTDPQRNVSIPLTATSGTGLTSSDYSGVPPPWTSPPAIPRSPLS